jgi:UDP-N-acetylmuramate dehydrogenase
MVRLDDIALFVLGGGTNLLIRDGGIRGVVLRLGRGFRDVRVEGAEIVAGAIAPMSKAARAAEDAELEGLEFGFDIPGTVGGALRMNAGAHGSEIKDILKEARGFDPAGQFHQVSVSDAQFGYRTAIYPVELLFTEAVFAMRPGDRETLAARRKEYHEYRLRTQPKGNTVGSVFVNPEDDHAGRLVDVAGLKGHRIGGAVVSEKHGNWILNDRQATATEIEALIRTVQQTVREKFGVELATEVRIVGEPEPAGANER